VFHSKTQANIEKEKRKKNGCHTMIEPNISMQGWLKAQVGKATALGLKASKTSKKFNML